MRSSRNGVTALPLMCAASASASACARTRSCSSGVPGLIGRNGVRDHDALPVAERVLRPHDRGDLGGGIHRPVELNGTLAQPEAREDARAVPDDRDAQGLEPLERRGDVEHRLHPGAHHGDRRVREGRQVGRLVERVGRAAVHAAEPARGEHADAGERGEVRRRSHRGRGARAARLDDRQVAHARLGEVLVGDAPHALVVEADPRDAVEHGDRRGRHALVAQDALELAGRLEVARAGKPVRDDRGLERDDRSPAFERGGDLFRDDECRHATILASGAGARVRTGGSRRAR